jgi:hypothetical protein
MLFLRDQAVSISANLVHLKDLVDRCLSKGAKISTVFIKRSGILEGDGESKETAFFFPKARTPAEAIELTYRYLEESEIKLIGDRQNAGIGEGFIYDVYLTSRGRIWFKIPMQKF